MANLTYLNDASVLHNLRDRYQRWLIYVSEHRILSHRSLCFCFLIDLLRSLLCGYQSIQTFTDLYNQSGYDVSRQKTY